MASETQPPTDIGTPPNDLTAEQAMIGACLVQAEALDLALEMISADDLYREAHRIILGAMCDVRTRGDAVDIVSTCSELRRVGSLETVGGSEYLTAMIEHCPTAAHVRKYAYEVARTSLARQAIQIGSRLAGDAYSNPVDVAELLGAAIGELDSLQERCILGSQPKALHERTGDDLVRIKDRMDREHEVSAARWGLPVLDRMTGGLEDVGYMVLKGGTNAGKSSLVCQMILSTAMQLDEAGSERVLVFGMEEDGWRWMQRAVCWLGSVDSRDLANAIRWRRACKADQGNAEHPGLEERYWDAVSLYASLPVVLASGPQSLGSIEAHCKRFLRNWRPALVTVDYLQLLGKDESYATEERGFREVAERMTRLRDLLGCPLVCTSQVTKGADGEEHAFGARAFEFNADTVARIARKKDAEKGWEPTAAIHCDKAREVENWGRVSVRTDFRTGRWYAEAETVQTA